MVIKVEFFATLREVLGIKSLELGYIGGCTVGEVINILAEKFGRKFRDELMEGGMLRELVKALVNGKDVRELKGLETEVKDGDCISIFPPVAGG